MRFLHIKALGRESVMDADDVKGGKGKGPSRSSNLKHPVKTGTDPFMLHAWQIVLGDDEDGELALKALQFKDWDKVRLIPAGRDEYGSETDALSYFSIPGAEGELRRLDLNLEQKFREGQCCGVGVLSRPRLCHPHPPPCVRNRVW